MVGLRKMPRMTRSMPSADQRLPRLTSLGKMVREISRRMLDQVHSSAPWAG